MKKKQRKIESQRKKEKVIPLGLSARNYLLLGLGLAVLIVGYIFLSIGPASSFWSLTLAPILLVFSYCIIMPVAILYRKKAAQTQSTLGD